MKLIETLRDLPEEFSIDELIERRTIIQKIYDGQKQSKDGLKLVKKRQKK